MKKLFTLILLIGLIAFVLIDRTLSPDFTALMAGDNPPRPEDNGYLNYLGLNAPATDDAHAAGARIIDGFNAWWPGHKPGPSYWLALIGQPNDENMAKTEAGKYHPAVSGAPLKLIPPANPAKGALNCWLMPKTAWETFKKDFPAQSACLTQPELGAYLTQNKILLDRYAAMLAMPRFYEPFGISMIHQDTIDTITLNQLYVASLVLYARAGYTDDSVRRWLAMQNAMNRIVADQQTTIAKTVLTIPSSQSLQAILEHTPAKAATYQPQILAVLTPPAFGSGGLDMGSITRAEYNYAVRPLDESSSLLTKPLYTNMTKNNLAACNGDALALKSPADQIIPNLKAAETSRNEAAKSPHRQLDLYVNYVGTFLTWRCQQASAIEMRLKTLRTKALNAAWVSAVAADIKPPAMAAWLKNAPATFRNPVTGQPFEWDAARNSLYIPGPEKKDREMELFYPVPIAEKTLGPVNFVPPIFPGD